MRHFCVNAVFLFIIVLCVKCHECATLQGTTDDLSITPIDDQPRIFVTLSVQPWTYDNRTREIMITWENFPDKLKGYAVRIYDFAPGDLEDYIVEIDVEIEVNVTNKNYIRSQVFYPERIFTKDDVPDGCVDVWVTLMLNKQLQQTACLRTRPTWMKQLMPKIGNKRLLDIMIPGTHNSGSYNKFSPDHSVFLKYRDCQEQDIFNQLVAGSRFLDLRVGYKLEQGVDFWIYHDVLQTNHPLKVVLNDVRNFLEMAPSEIVIIDFHRYPVGIESNATVRIRELVNLIETELGSLIVPAELQANTIEDLVKANKRAYVSFYWPNDAGFRQNFITEAKHIWANTDNIDELKTILEQQLRKHKEESNSLARSSLYSAMAELTPKGFLQVIRDDYNGGIRGITQRTADNISAWFRTPDFYKYTNVVAVDYLLRSTIVETAIAVNNMQ